MTDIYTSMAEVRAANEKAGYHFFDDDTMKFFNSEIHGELLPGDYFITSESYTGEDSERKYTVRRARGNGSIETCGGSKGFHTYDSYEVAVDASRLLHLADRVTFGQWGDDSWVIETVRCQSEHDFRFDIEGG